MEEKHLQLERTVFFCDAVVAIAITLLVFNLKVDHITGTQLTFDDIGKPWKTFLAFVLSFLNIASFWKNHHTFFAHIVKIDERLLAYNILWLFFIVLLPFSTSLYSAHFFDTPAIFVYSLNTFFITVFQNMIWDYGSGVKERVDFLDHKTIDKPAILRIQQYCNLDMLNALLAVAISFFAPVLAFICLFTKFPMIILARMILGKTATRENVRRVTKIDGK